MSVGRRAPGVGLFLSSLFAVAMIGLLTSELGAMLLQSGAPGVATAVIITLAGLLAVGYLSLHWWSRLDEAAREAHKSSWWWGGVVGMCFGGVTLFMVEHAARPGVGSEVGLLGQPLDTAAGGALLIILSQAVCYAAAWAVWWLRRR